MEVDVIHFFSYFLCDLPFRRIGCIKASSTITSERPILCNLVISAPGNATKRYLAVFRFDYAKCSLVLYLQEGYVLNIEGHLYFKLDLAYSTVWLNGAKKIGDFSAQNSNFVMLVTHVTLYLFNFSIFQVYLISIASTKTSIQIFQLEVEWSWAILR